MSVKPYPVLEKAVSHRKWLNPSGSGHILWSVGMPKVHAGKNKMKPWVDGPTVVFTLADCSRMINLDFECWDNTSTSPVLKKVDLLCDEVIAFRIALYRAYTLHTELKENL